MRNGTRSNHRLMLVDNNGEEISAKNSLDDIAVATDMLGEEVANDGPGPIDDLMHNKALFATVSIACLTAAIAAGSYAIWLSKKKQTQEALTSVNDLLKTCQNRMTQIDRELKRLPRAQ